MGLMKRIAYASACLIILFVIVNLFVFNRIRLNERNSKQNLRTFSQKRSRFKTRWHDNKEIEAALKMEGLGQVGRPAYIESYRKELYNKYGFDALLSDVISLQRSVPDVRPLACKNLTYDEQLPRPTVIITFHNERLSVLLRTVYSILNRTPAVLLHEIILVDDGSTWPDMHGDLENYLRLHFPPESGKVRLIRQAKRTGIMSARMAGARNASEESEVLIFLDSHFEVGYNWLPPLLQPIVLDPKTCTCPIIDRITFDTFQYKYVKPKRGCVDYSFNYQMIAPPVESFEQPEKNIRNFVMMGGAMAIDKNFFWRIGGFDEGMTQWGGEQFEMSLKIWMCDGQILDVPCSRMGHLFRDVNTKGNSLLYGNYEYCNRNYKRILDVWIDEDSRKLFLEQRPVLKDLDAGDVAGRHAIRQRLQCKSFSWIIENLMPEVEDLFSPKKPLDLASGFIRSEYDRTLCMALGNSTIVRLELCPEQGAQITQNLNWQYKRRGHLRISDSNCLESDKNSLSVGLFDCHAAVGNQKWYFDRNKQWIAQMKANVCIMANTDDRRIDLAVCDEQNIRLKWSFSHMNIKEMKQWENK